MKLIVAFVAVCVFAAVQGEQCRGDGDCNLEHCVGDGWSVRCHFSTCTCENSSGSGGRCTTLDQCKDHRCPNFLRPHCVDGTCRCSR